MKEKVLILIYRKSDTFNCVYNGEKLWLQAEPIKTFADNMERVVEMIKAITHCEKVAFEIDYIND